MPYLNNARLPIKEENILILDESKDAKDVIAKLSALLEKTGDVKPSFCEAVLEREKSMPTGLELDGEIHAAIPHADVEHVLNPSLAMAVLRQPVAFKCMVEPEKDLSVGLVFLLAMNEPKKQVEMLQQVATILQNSQLIQSLYTAKSSREVIDLIAKME